MKTLVFLATTVLVSLFVLSFTYAAVEVRMTLVDDFNDPSIPTVAVGGTFTCYFWIDPGTDDVGGFSFCVSYPENIIVPTNLASPFTDASYIAGSFELSNKRTEVAGGDDKLDYSRGAFGATGSGVGKLATVEFEAIAPLPTAGVIQWCGLGAPDPDTIATTEISIGGAPVTPDIHPDKPLPVALSRFAAESIDNGVKIVWRTESELNNLGFDVYRGESIDGPFTKVTPALIKGAGTDSTPHSYKFIDESVGVSTTYYYYLENISFDGARDRSDIIRVIIDKSGKLNVGLATPEFALLQNFPNPFNPETWIPFRLGNEADVTIRIFDVKGQNIRTIHLSRLSAGFYTTRGKAAFWDGKDSFGESVSSGIYFYNLTAGDLSATKKLTVVK
jgi:hypothetical protein